jgi:cell division protein FtsN
MTDIEEPQLAEAPPPDTQAVAVRAEADSTQPEPVEGDRQIYIQVNFSQNEGWARALAQQLRDTGFEAQVLVGTGAEGGYRVVLGPYPSREAADAVGRRLGRSYFIMPQGAVGT